MKINLLSVTLLILLISGCATTSGYEQRLNSWMGTSEVQLIRSWGVPAQVYQTGNSKYLVYNSSRNVYLPGSSPAYTTTFIGNTAYTSSYGGSAPQNINFQCQTTFEIINGQLMSWRYKGNDCTAPELEDVAKVDKDVIYRPKKNKNYASLNLNTKEKKAWFRDLTNKLLDGKIDKNTFVEEGLKRYPTRKKELKSLARRIAGS